LLRKRRRGDCSVVILLLLAVTVGGWFYLQRRDFNRRTSPEFLEELKKLTLTLSGTKETRPDGKTQVYVVLKNGARRTFDGKIVVFSREISGVVLDQTTLTLMPLSPGESMTLIAWLRKSAIRPDFQYELDVEFK